MRGAKVWSGAEEEVIQAKAVNQVDAERDRGGGGEGNSKDMQ